jgi:hypothetical protein
LPQHIEQGAGRDGIADGLLGERLPLRAQDPRTAAQAAIGEGDVGGDRDVAGFDAFRDPVIGGVESAFHDDELDQILRRHPERRVRDDVDLDAVPAGNPVDLLLDRAGVGINIDGHWPSTPTDDRAWSFMPISAPVNPPARWASESRSPGREGSSAERCSMH